MIWVDRPEMLVHPVAKVQVQVQAKKPKQETEMKVEMVKANKKKNNNNHTTNDHLIKTEEIQIVYLPPKQKWAYPLFQILTEPIPQLKWAEEEFQFGMVQQKIGNLLGQPPTEGPQERWNAANVMQKDLLQEKNVLLVMVPDFGWSPHQDALLVSPTLNGPMEPNAMAVRSGFVIIVWAKITLAQNVKIPIYPSMQKEPTHQEAPQAIK